MPSTQSCRSCRWFEPGSTESVGTCCWPAHDLPDSITEWVMNTTMSGYRGQSCPTWEPAETEGLFSRPSDDAAFEVLKRDFGIGD